MKNEIEKREITGETISLNSLNSYQKSKLRKKGYEVKTNKMTTVCEVTFVGYDTTEKKVRNHN